MEGAICPLAKRGCDGKRDKPQINGGMVTDGRGCPVAVTVFYVDIADNSPVLEEGER